jgi:hypothetical protein
MSLSCPTPLTQVAKAASSDSDDSSEEEDSEDEAPKDQVGDWQTSPSVLLDSHKVSKVWPAPSWMLTKHFTFAIAAEAREGRSQGGEQRRLQRGVCLSCSCCQACCLTHLQPRA